MEIQIDTQTISEAGFDNFLVRAEITSTGVSLGVESRYVDSSNLVGGIIGSEGIIYLGSKQFKLDGKNRRMTIGDGILIGYDI